MEKYRIEALIGDARRVLEEQYKDGSIERTMRSKMSGFGAAVIMGGILPAIAFYAKNEEKILVLLQKLYQKKHPEEKNSGNLFALVDGKTNPQEISEELLAMSVSLKMAMNTFRLVEPQKEER